MAWAHSNHLSVRTTTHFRTKDESLTNMLAGGVLQKVIPVNSGSHGNGSPLKRKASVYP